MVSRMRRGEGGEVTTHQSAPVRRPWGVFRRRRDGRLYTKPDCWKSDYANAWRAAVATANIVPYDVILAPLDQAGALPGVGALLVRADGTAESASGGHA